MMKMRQLLVATIVLAALAATLYWSNHRKPANDSVIASPSATNAKVISLTQDDISKLEVKKKDGDDVVLNRVGASNWKITSPKSLVADQDSVSTILYNLSPMDGATLIDEKAADLKQFGLAEPEAQVSATGKDGKTHTILVGDETPTGDSAYVMVSGESKVYSVPKNTKANLDKGLKDLRDKRLMPVDFDKLSSVEISGAKLHLTFGSDDGQVDRSQSREFARGHFQDGNDHRKTAHGDHGPQHFGRGHEEGRFPVCLGRPDRDLEGHGRVRLARAANSQSRGRLLRENDRDGRRV